MKTEDLIERLAHDVEPRAPLRPPWLRAAIWLIATLVYMTLLAALMTSATDARLNAAAPAFLVSQVAAIVLAAAAAVAAFSSVVPGEPTRIPVWATLAIVGWLGSLLVGSAQEWRAEAAIDPAATREWICVVTIALGGALPAIGMERMLRQGAPLKPRTTMALAVLASAVLANVVACVSHPHTSMTVVLVWHGVTVAALAAAAAWVGRTLFSWRRVHGGRDRLLAP